MKKHTILLLTFGTAVLLTSASCTSVKEYQKSKLNDADMTLGARKSEKTELNFETYREGAAGANGGKTGGGCGCN
ncbi:MAG TPA: DUF4266 domain-containing protein [Agriterribacter sp.]|nr:DUF4266 domain-containing protein [Agriterribacter sp.]